MGWCIYGLVAVAAGLALVQRTYATTTDMMGQSPTTMMGPSATDMMGPSTTAMMGPSATDMMGQSPTAMMQTTATPEMTTDPVKSVPVTIMSTARSATPLRVSTVTPTELSSPMASMTPTVVTPTVTCRDVDVNCAYLDDHVKICSEPESALMLCARTCNMCGQGGETVSHSHITSTIRPLVTSALIATGTAIENRCNIGLVQCLDGRCEPFESLCEETGFVTTSKPPTMMTSSGGITMATSPVATSPSVSMGTMDASTSGFASTSPMVTQSTAQPTTHQVVTVSAGPNGCSDGWEKCADDTCEPFHWLCTEHDGTAGVIG